MDDVLVLSVFLDRLLLQRVAFEKGQGEFARGSPGGSGCHGVEVGIRGVCPGGYVHVGLESIQGSEW